MGQVKLEGAVAKCLLLKCSCFFPDTSAVLLEISFQSSQGSSAPLLCSFMSSVVICSRVKWM